MTDGSLPAARRRLADAIAALCDPVMQVVDGRQLFTSSWYMQLVDDLAGQQGQNHTPPRSLPLIWLDAWDLLQEIDTAVSAWQPDGTDTPTRLAAIQARPFRPQDSRSMDQISGCVESWTQNIRSLLVAERHWTLPSACPACGTRTVYRHDGDDLVRQPALQISPDGCCCARCKTAWEPSKFVWLARLLGYEMPAGLLE
jgi:hypothetical protein